MSREIKCILCETVHISKQEMEEHMRSMLHHRELEKLKGRDCGHECRVCKVTLVSLTEYASHISSPTHKQNVETAEQNPSGNHYSENYFDQALVDLIEKRKEHIRKEKEAIAAKLAAEEAEKRRKEEFQQRLKEAKEHYQLECSWKQSSHGFGRSNQHSSWYRNNGYNGRSEEARPCHHSKKGKSATWHAQDPPSLQKWTSAEFAGGSLHNQEGWNKKQWGQGAFYGNKQSRLPWVSNGGSSNGVYGRNNISQYPQRSRPLSLLGPPMNPALPRFFSPSLNQFQNTGSDQGGQQGENGESQLVESDHNNGKCGSNPKLDKVCRWSPYPVTKSFESGPHKDNQHSLDKNSKVYEKAPETCTVNRLFRPEQKPGQTTSGKNLEEKGKYKAQLKTKPKDGSNSSRSSSAQKDGYQYSSSGSCSERAHKPLLNKDRKMSLVPGLKSGTQLSKSCSQIHSQSKQTEVQGSKVSPIRSLQSSEELQQDLSQSLKKTRQIGLIKKGSLDSSTNNRLEMAHHVVEEKQKDCAQSQRRTNKENSCRQNVTKANLLDSVIPEKPALASLDSSQFLQSLQVTTSTMDGSEPGNPRQNDEQRKKLEKEPCSMGQDEVMQAFEAGQSSESDTSKSSEAQAYTSDLSKLDLPPVLKRDLTKHISSKNKTGSHEPNLNIARRVRTLSESRRIDTEKDSGLKPTVRQLISSSGSRRNVNWEQVYQEVRKKQDKGKGMPRFGIEMVPCEQEDHSQEEDEISLLEGFQWESLMDMTSQSATRKRSLSESSLTPAGIHLLSTQKDDLSLDHQGSSVSPMLCQENRDDHCQHEVELYQFETKAQKQPDKPTSATAKALQRSDSVLGESSSGTEQCDNQGTGKRRRAAGDVPSAETSCLEHNSKRRKVKSKKERLQIDQLLAVSLREEELSRSLQTVDTNLIQARAALQAAYLEVQRLMVVKQQVTEEMSTLRNKRIELLKGMQGGIEEAPQIKLKEEKMDLFDTELHIPSAIPSSVSTFTDTTTVFPRPSSPSHHASPPSCSLPLMHVIIKQEPQSPVHVSSKEEFEKNTNHFAHSTTTELPVIAATASPPESAGNFQPSPERKLELYKTEKEHIWENFGESADCRESVSGVAEMMEKTIQSTRKPKIEPPSPSRRGSEVESAVDCVASQSFEPPSVPSVLNLPASPSEQRSGNRVRKLKKRKSLKKAQGMDPPDSSDTEVDREATRPKWLRPRRRPSGGSQVSTSSLPTEGRDDINMEGCEEAAGLLFPTTKCENLDLHFSECMVELSRLTSNELQMNRDSEESMEVTPACQQPLVHASPPAQLLDSSRPEPQSLACNKVTSTSDMDICKSSESEMPFPITLPKMTKNSSDVSSDHSEDEIPTEGMFDGHQEAVNAMQIHNGLLYTCSGDRSIRAYDLVSHKCVATFEGHSSKVSSLLVSAAPSLHHRLYSGSSDQTIRCYSLKTQELEQQFFLSDRVLCLHSRWRTLYAGLANGMVATFNLKTNKQMTAFECHSPRAVSCLASSQEGARRILLVGSYDSTITVRDAKNGLLLRTLEGHTKTVLCMKVVNDLVFSGSSDQCVYTHNIHTGELVRVYKGHSHAVTVVTVLGKVMVTACLDKLVRVYDLQTHEQLQVYGGHKDMVMCMAIHKNMIYTGCYDGSVQAIKLNLMQNYRCWWHGCSLVFGVTEHLQQHLISDHTSSRIQTLMCRWKNCEEFFCARNNSKQGMLVHMQKHAEEETEVEP